MKYIKTYENNIPQIDPQIGDYVIINAKKIRWIYPDFIIDFLNNNIGQIIKKVNNNYTILYENSPTVYNEQYPLCKNKTWNANPDDFLKYSKDKSKLEMLLTTKKYNL